MSLLDTKFANECQIRMKWKLKEDDVRKAQKPLYSDTFLSNIPGVQYCLEFYPNEISENITEAEAYLHLYFKMIKEISADFTISVNSASSKIKFNEIYDNSKGWGRTLCTRDELFNPEKKFFIDGIMELELEGTLKAHGIKRKAPESLSLTKYLWESNDKDLTITVENKEIKVHKCIFGANSSVFEDEFKTFGKRAAKKKIIINEFCYETVKIALEFFYERNNKESHQ